MEAEGGLGGPPAAPRGGGTAPAEAEPPSAPGEETTEVRYRRYLRRQATRFLSLVPREGVRPLYREAVAWSAASGRTAGRDPMSLLVAYLTDRLPLPPMDVWEADRRAHPDAHLEEAWDVAPRPSRPVTVSVRPLRHPEGPWYACLELFEDGHGWKGHIAFHREASERRYRTAEIFVGDEPGAIRERFLEFDEPTLGAFLRSVLP